MLIDSSLMLLELVIVGCSQRVNVEATTQSNIEEIQRSTQKKNKGRW
jgi:hypothetical protein